MLRFYTKPAHRLRVFISGETAEKALLFAALHCKFYESTEYDTEQDSDENIIFYEGGEDKESDMYGPIRLLPLIKSEVSKLRLEYEEDIPSSTLDIPVEIKEPVDPDILEGITLRDYQITSVERALKYRSGILKVCTGGGKTEIALAVIRYLLSRVDGNIIMCVPSTKLLYQTKERALKRGFDDRDITLYGDGNRIDLSCRILIATVQTLYRRLTDPDFIEWYQKASVLVMDEAHHCSARTFYSVVDTLSPEYVLGVTAEPYYGTQQYKIQDLLVRGLLGPILYEVTVPMLVEKGYLSKPYLLVFESQCPQNIFNSQNWAYIQKAGLVGNPDRNRLIIEISKSLITVGKKPLILISQIKHGGHLATQISASGYFVALLTGGSSVALYRDGVVIEELQDNEGEIPKRFTEGEIDVLIGTSVLDEGVDIPAISSVILAGGGKSPIKVVQRLGRSLRPKPGDNTTILIDFLDGFNVVTRSHSKQRRSIITALGVEQYACGRQTTVDDSIKSRRLFS